MEIQRYVSPDLTHFVGRGRKTFKDQYRVLRRILREGTLRAPISNKPEREPYIREVNKRKPYLLEIKPSESLSENKAFRGTVVCFCDIPIADLGLHMLKYGRFGLAFSKRFALERGASPVMYIPRRSRPALLPWANYGRGRVSSHAVAFDEFWRYYQKLCQAADDHSVPQAMSETIQRVSQFLNVHVLSHLKFFDPFAAGWEKENFYMEREWRVSGNLRFHLRDVRRVIIPESYGRRFRRDFPKYDGEILFSD